MPPRSLNALLADIQARPSVYFPALGKGGAGRTAQAATYLNYGPQFDALAAMLGGAREARRTGVQSAQRSGQAGAQGITKIRDSFVQGAGESLGSLGGPVASGAPVASPEARAAQQLGLSGTALAGMLSGMAAQQVAGVGNQTRQLNRQFQTDRQQIGDKIGALFGQAGAYNTQQFETLAGAQRKMKADAAKALTDQRIRLITAGINPETGQYDPSLDAPKTQSASDRKAAADLAFFQENGYYPGTGKPDAGGMTPAAKRERIERYAKVRDRIVGASEEWNRLLKQKAWITEDGELSLTPVDGAKPYKPSRDFLIGRLEKKYDDLPPVERRAAIEFAIFDGQISRETRTALQKRYKGLELPKGWHGSTRKGERAQNAIDW